VRVLNCPGLANDYYLNLLHMSERNGLLAIGLGSSVYLWNSATAEITALGDENNDEEDGEEPPAVTSLRWTADGSNLAVGYASARTKLWDVATSTAVQTLHSHSARVSCLDWNTGTSANSFMLASGGADNAIYTHDVRQHSSRSVVAHYAHKEEVCGLAFSPDGTQLASGANDNKLCIWNLRAAAGAPMGGVGGASSGHLLLGHHSAAVKALAWCPWQDKVLASGGGLADGHIRFCNSVTGAQIQAVDTASQVCSLQFARGGERELLSAHGHPNHFIALWKCGGPGPADLTRITTLQGHTSRVLHTAMSPDGSTCISASADETLRFWKVWKPVVAAKQQNGPERAFRNSPMHMRIR
jgi:cell division cycle protein 20 (cofactor of APC complex)